MPSFEERSVALPAAMVSALLDELCDEFGLCLARSDYQAIQARPPTSPRAFAELVAKLESLDTDDDFFGPVLQLVSRTFEGIAKDSTA